MRLSSGTHHYHQQVEKFWMEMEMRDHDDEGQQQQQDDEEAWDVKRASSTWLTVYELASQGTTPVR